MGKEKKEHGEVKNWKRREVAWKSEELEKKRRSMKK